MKTCLVANAILNVHDIKAAWVAVAGSDNANTAHVTTVGDDDLDSDLEVDEVVDVSSLKVDLHGVTNLKTMSHVFKNNQP